MTTITSAIQRLLWPQALLQIGEQLIQKIGEHTLPPIREASLKSRLLMTTTYVMELFDPVSALTKLPQGVLLKIIGLPRYIRSTPSSRSLSSMCKRWIIELIVYSIYAMEDDQTATSHSLPPHTLPSY